MTLLSPFLIAALIIAPIWLGSIKDTEVKHIAVIDQAEKYGKAFESGDTYIFEIVDQPINNIRENKDYYALILISDDLVNNPDAVTIYADNQVGLEFKSYISGQLNSFVENEKLNQYNISDLKKIIEESKTHINIKTVKWSDDGSETETSSEIAMIIGMFSAFLIYMFLFVYGTQVMRGIVEEKTSRIVEVIISSVKPFELMIGKITGIALVGLTQFVIWAVLLAGILFVFGNDMGINTPAQDMMSSTDVAELSSNPTISALMHYNFWEIGIFFVLFFLGGYLLYASLFAAIGAAADNETDTQQFMIPLTIPVIFALYAAIYSANNPDGPLAFWTSVIPFTLPIVMMVRIPLGVPLWQLILSVGILFLSFVGTTWLAAKIYRTGILMYGKKISYKEIWKWIRYK